MQVSPLGPNVQQVEPVQVPSESQKHQQQTSQGKQEYQSSAVSNLQRESHLVLSINHVVSHFPGPPVTIEERYGRIRREMGEALTMYKGGGH